MVNRFSDVLQNSRNPYLNLCSIKVYASRLLHKIFLPGELEIFMNQCVGAEKSGQSQQVSGSGPGNMDSQVKAQAVQACRPDFNPRGPHKKPSAVAILLIPACLR